MAPVARSRRVVENNEWTRADAWVLAAVRVSGTAERPATLFDLVAACDAVNRLIASRPEIEHAIGLLVGAELVVADESGFSVTPLGRAVVTEAGRAALGIARHESAEARTQARMEALLELLVRLPVRPVPWTLDPRDYEAACLEYRHTMWTEYRRPGRRR